MFARCLGPLAFLLILKTTASALATLPTAVPAEYLIEPPGVPFYRVIIRNGHSERVIRAPITGGETVLDAIGRIDGLPAICSKRKIWVTRPATKKGGWEILPVKWRPLTEQGSSETNHTLRPGDQIHIGPGKPEPKPPFVRVPLQGFIQLQPGTVTPGTPSR